MPPSPEAPPTGPPAEAPPLFTVVFSTSSLPQPKSAGHASSQAVEIEKAGTALAARNAYRIRRRLPREGDFDQRGTIGLPSLCFGAPAPKRCARGVRSTDRPFSTFRFRSCALP